MTDDDLREGMLAKEEEEEEGRGEEEGKEEEEGRGEEEGSVAVWVADLTVSNGVSSPQPHVETHLTVEL
jgi:hypothetical protein